MGYAKNGMQRKKGYKRRQPMPSLHFAPAADQTSTDRRNGVALTITRTTEHAYHNSAGTLVVAASGAFAYPHSYDGSNWTADGFGSHLAATNVCLQSEVTGTTWAAGNGGVTLAANAIAAPDGETTADSLKQIDNVNDHLLQTITLSANTDYTLSLYAKNIDATTSSLAIFDATGSTTEGQIDITWTAGVPSLADGGGTTTVTSMVVTDVSDGWYRLSGTFKTDATNTSHQYRIFPETTDTAAQGIYAWGMDLKTKTIVTPYIATTTGAVTRNRDDIQTSDVTWYRDAQGTFIWRGIISPLNGVARYLFSVNDGTTTDRNAALIHSSDKDRCLILDGGVLQVAAALSNVPTADTLRRYTQAHELNNFSHVSENQTLGADTSCTMPEDMTTFDVGQSSISASQLIGATAEIIFIKTRKSNSFLQTRSIT